MNRKPSRGILGYFALIGTLLLIAILLNGGLNRTVSKRIEDPDLLKAISEGEVGRVAIRGNSLVGVYDGKNRQTTCNNPLLAIAKIYHAGIIPYSARLRGAGGPSTPRQSAAIRPERLRAGRFQG